MSKIPPIIAGKAAIETTPNQGTNTPKTIRAIPGALLFPCEFSVVMPITKIASVKIQPTADTPLPGLVAD